jgi:hypothetical protein
MMSESFKSSGVIGFPRCWAPMKIKSVAVSCLGSFGIVPPLYYLRKRLRVLYIYYICPYLDVQMKTRNNQSKVQLA